MDLKPFDAIIVGSGANGGVAALTLAKAGVRVLIIEAGPTRSIDETYGSEPVNTFNRFFGIVDGKHKKQSQHPGFWKANPLLYADERENNYEYPSKKPFLWTQGRQLGGKSLTWGGITLRLSDLDMKAPLYDGIGPSWPIEYSDLSDHYSSLENFLRVYGHKDNLEHLPDGEFVGYLPFTKSEQIFAEKVKLNFGYSVIHSRGFESNFEQKDKSYPRSSSLGSTLKIALSTGNVQILDNHIAERIIMKPTEEIAKGLLVLNKKENKRFILESNLIVLSASTIQTLKLLLNSEKSNQENGFIDESNTLGKYLMDHISICRFFNYPKYKEINNPVKDKNHKLLSGAGSFFIPFGNNSRNYNQKKFKRGYGIWGAIDRFDPPSILKTNPQKTIGFLIAHGEVLPNVNNKVSLSNKKDKWGINIPKIEFEWGKNEKEMVKHMTKTMENIITSTGGEIKSLDEIIRLPFIKQILKNSFATQDSPPPPGYYIHEVGGAAMGLKKETSVLDKWNRLWRCKNVLVVDGSAWPTSSWQSPTLTMMALCRRACLKAIERR